MRKHVQFLTVGCALLALALLPGAALTSVRAETATTLAVISGTVTDDAGRPLGGAVVALFEVALNGRELKSVKTEYDGKFTTSISAGVYKIRAAADGHRAALTRVSLDASEKMTFDFALKREDRLVDQRGDRDDYRWIGRSVPRHVLHLDANGSSTSTATSPSVDVAKNETIDRYTDYRPSFHGAMQFVAASSLAGSAFAGPASFGTNFAVAGNIRGVEMALIGQRGFGGLAPQRVEAIASLRPAPSHQITASVGYGEIAYGKPRMLRADGIESDFDNNSVIASGAASGPVALPAESVQLRSAGPAGIQKVGTLNQVSVSAVGQWQVFQPLLVIYGFDYARFVGSAARQRDSILPRLAFQYSPGTSWRFNAALTPGSEQGRLTGEGLSTENIEAPFEDHTAELAYADAPVLDRSRRLEFGVERIFEKGKSSLEASAFYDIIAGHGVGVLALPLEASPATQQAFREAAQIAYQVSSINSAARGVRFMYARQLTEELTAAVGYSFGSGSRLSVQPPDQVSPAGLVTNGFFQVATAKLDLDLSERTGTRVSTVVRLSPDAVVFAIDPFAGRMSVYDPNINVYVTQELPTFGLPWRWQAIIDIRNILNQLNGTEDGNLQLVATRSFRSVRGGVMFSW